MIPTSSLFYHLQCGFGENCDRIYCPYFHSEKPSNTQTRTPTSPQMSPQMSIAQEEDDYYNDFTYHAYVEQPNRQIVNDFPTYEPFPYATDMGSAEHQEDIGQFIPVKPDYTPKTLVKPSEKRKHYEYSVLDDKPVIPVDLGNDEILLGLNSANKAPPKKKQKREVIQPIKEVKKVNKPEPIKKSVQQPIDTEKEMREIELLERKTKLLKEYKQLAEQIAQIESKKASYSEPNFVESLFEDDEPPSTSTSNSSKITKPTVTNSIPADSNKRIANTVTIKKPISMPSKVITQPTQPTRTPIQRIAPHNQMLNRFSLATNSSVKSNENKSVGITGSLSKTDNSRLAHKAPTLDLVPVDRFATKIPFSTRMRSLKKLHEEFCKYSEIEPNQAIQMSQTEEKLLFDKSQTATGYASSLAGAVREIRNKQFTIPTVNSQGKVIKASSITETMEKDRKAGERRMSEEQFYRVLREKYVMTSEQLKINGYPYIIKNNEGKKRVKIDCVDEKKLFSDDNDFSRTCCRCGIVFALKPDGSFVSQQDCIFHWKRAFKKRINRALESRYGCCDSDLTVKGCAIFPKHVHQTMRRSVLRQFIRTPPPEGTNDLRSKKVYAMDCEMVYSTWGMSLARVSIVDWNDDLVLDMIIKPSEEVLDCNTKFSGLTMEMLENAQYDLNKARKKMFEFVNSETILIGHSLESDLKSMRLVHRRIVDTSIVYPHRLGPPMKRALRNLASDYLQKIIQEDVEGHDSKEDSTVCMQLMIQKTEVL